MLEPGKEHDILEFGKSTADQLRAAVVMQEHPMSIFLKVYHPFGETVMVINQQNQNVVLDSPETMRLVAGMMLDRAAAWERGELRAD